MMAADSKDFELRVRARDYSGKTLEQVTDALRDLAKVQEEQLDAAKKGGASAKELEASYRKLESVVKALASQGALTKTYEAQSRALEEAKQRTEAARTSQEAYARALGSAADLTKAQVREQARLAAAVSGAERVQQRAQTRIEQTAQKLRAVGIATDDIAAAQRRIVVAVGQGNAALERQDAAIASLDAGSRRAAQSTTQVAAAVRLYGQASSDANKSALFGSDGGRGTVTLLQRIRTELLGVAAAYGSVQGAAGIAGGAVDAFNTRDGAKNQLALSLGSDRQAIDAEYQYVRAQSDRIGIEFERAIKGYAKFSAAATLAGRSRQEIRYIFETFSELGRVANLSKEDLDGVFKALEQITSKGKIQAEELRGQLGDRLFGAFEVAAQSLKDQFPDLDKALKDGIVTSDQLVKIAEQYRKIIANELPAAQQSLAAEQMRVNNAVFDFKLAIADAGFADTFKKVLAEIVVFLKSEDGQRFAEGLSATFDAAGKVLISLLTNLTEVKAAVSTFVALWVGMQLRSSIVQVTDLASSIRNLSTAATIAQKAFFAFQAFIVGWQIGSYLNEKFVEVRRFGVSLVTGLDEVWTRIKYGAQVLWEEVPRYARNAMALLLGNLTAYMRLILATFAKGARAIGADGLADSIERAVEGMTLRYEQQGDRVAAIRQQMERDIQAIRDIGADMFNDAERKTALRSAASSQATPTPRPNPGKARQPGPTEADLKRRASLIESIQRQLETLNAGIDRAAKQSLSQQLEAVDEQYAKLQRDINKLGAGDREAIAFAAELERLKGEKKLQVTREFNASLLQANEAIQSKLEQLDASAGRKEKVNLHARLQAISDSYAATYREIEAYRQRLSTTGASDEPAQLARERLDAGLAELKALETQKFFKDEVARREQEINDLLATRAARIKTIGDQEAAGFLTNEQAQQQSLDVVQRLQPELDRLAGSGIEFAASIQGAFDPTKLDEFIARLELARGSGARVGAEMQVTGRTINEMIAGGALNSFENIGQSLGEAAIGTKSWGSAVKDTATAFLSFAADFLRQIALMIAKTLILKTIENSGVGGIVSGALNAAVKHDGGVIGSVPNRSRTVAASWFANAPRYHAGGVSGLAPDEFPAILQRNEEVLSKDSPRNILNGGAGVSGAGTARSSRFVLVDDRSKVAEAMQSAEGEQVTLLHLRRNIASLKQWLR